MADGIIINTGTGPTVAAEMIGTALHQKIKFVVGGSGTAGTVVFGQTNMAASFPVVIADNQTAIPITFSTGTVSISGTSNFIMISGTVSTGLMSISGTVPVTIGTPTITVATGVVTISNTVPVTFSTGTVSLSGTSNFIMISGTVSTGTVSLSGTSNFIMVSGTVTTGTISLSGTSNVAVVGTPAVTAANVTIASVTTGTVSSYLIPQSVLGTTAHGGFILVPNASKFSAYAFNTTSAAGGVIIKTSGANTIYVTDILVSVASPMSVTLMGSGTPLAVVYLATNGGWVQSFINPLICTSAQSFVVVCGSSGTCSVMANGYTVT